MKMTTLNRQKSKSRAQPTLHNMKMATLTNTSQEKKSGAVNEGLYAHVKDSESPLPPDTDKINCKYYLFTV